jgi:cytochrome c553
VKAVIGAVLLATAPLVGFTGAAQAADPQVGRQKAAQCNLCHGPLGLSTAPETPHLAGQPAGYLVSQLKHFRDGTRRHEVMNVMAKPLSDADIEHLAAWFASLKVEVSPP